MIVKFIPLLSTFSTQNIQFGTLEERRNARSNINILFPSELENTTLILDATPLPIERRRDEPLNGDEGVWDEAHKMFAYKVIALMDLNYIFRFVSEAKPGAHQDIYRLRENKRIIEEKLDPDDVILCDTGFQGFTREARVGTWFIKKKSPPLQMLSAEDAKRNQKIESIRRYIEFGFGDLKGKFDILCIKYRHSRKWLPDIARFCFAVHNLIKIYEHFPERFSTVYSGPIPTIDDRRKRGKKRQIVWYHEEDLPTETRSNLIEVFDESNKNIQQSTTLTTNEENANKNNSQQENTVRSKKKRRIMKKKVK